MPKKRIFTTHQKAKPEKTRLNKAGSPSADAGFTQANPVIKETAAARPWGFMTTLIFCLSLGLVMGAGIFFRLLPVIQNEKPYVRNIAKRVVYSQLRQQVQLLVEKNYSFLNEKEKIKLADEEYKKLAEKNSKQIAATIEDGVKQMLSNTKPSFPYLLEADSYYFFGLTDNIAQTGRISEKIKHGKYFNPLMLAPDGKWEPLSLHPYLGFYLYKIIAFFKKDITLISAVKFLVILLAALCALPFLLVCYKLGVSRLAAFAGAVFFILSPFFAQRTAYGWYDTDVYSFLFPLIILFFIFSGFYNLGRTRRMLIYAVCASFSTGMYELFWHGWPFLVVLMTAALPVILLFDRILNKSANLKAILIFYFTYIFTTFLWVIVLVSPETFIYTFQEGWTTLNSFLSAKFDLWPNIFLTVGETQPISADKIAFLLSGTRYFLILSLLGILIASSACIKNRDFKKFAGIIVISCFVCIFTYLSLKAVRFAVQLTPPISLAFTLFLDQVYGIHKLPVFNRPGLKRAAGPLRLLLGLAVLSSMIFPIYASYQICTHINPIYNSTWEKTLKQIREQTPLNSIINTWWCPGHLITAVAKRRVTVDGASQQEPQTYWIANVLLAQDEKTALGLLRMLNLSGNKALVYLENTCKVITSDAVALLKEIAPLNEGEARVLLLSRNFNTTDVENILGLLYGTPPPSYLMIYTELADTYATLPYIGNWDFKKAEYLILNKLVSQKDTKTSYAIPSRDSAGYIDFIVSLSGGIPSCSPEYTEVYKDNDIIKFQNNIIVNRKTKECLLLSPDGTRFVRPKSLFYIDNLEFKEKQFPPETLPHSVLLIEKDGVYHCLLLDRMLAESMLFKLYYLKGKGLSHFKPFICNEDPVTNMTIMVYKIEW